MPGHRHIDIVVVERMRGSTIDERCRKRGQPGVIPDDAGLGCSARFRQFVEQKTDERIRGPGDGYPEIVERALAGDLARRCGQVLIAESAPFSGEGEGEIGRLGAPRCSRSVHLLAPVQSRFIFQSLVW